MCTCSISHHTHMHTHTQTHSHAHSHKHNHTHTHMCTHTNTLSQHTHTHTHTHTLGSSAPLYVGLLFTASSLCWSICCRGVRSVFLPLCCVCVCTLLVSSCS